MEVAAFTCSICGDTSQRICVFCTKDACRNHLCQRCHRCSDCCECEMPASSQDDEFATGQAEPVNGVPVGLATTAS